MVIIHLSGGFGNQLFSYALGYAVAKVRNDSLTIDTAIQDANWFFRNPDILQMDITYDKRLSYKIGENLWERGPINKARFRMAIGLRTMEIREEQIKTLGIWTDEFKAYVSKDENIYLRGNWGAEAYFKPVADEIKKLFVFRDKLSSRAQILQDEILKTENSVGIHYRLGDYVKLGIYLDPNCFISSMKYIAERVENPVFYCFSEDREWVRKQFANLPYDIRYPLYQSENIGIEDFRLFKLTKHQIISNSSYSWWAAYLKEQDGMVIMPFEDVWTPNFAIDDWIKLKI